MEPEIIASDLLALSKLYALLGRAETPELLDEKARLLLKNLLDGAAERVLLNHSEIIASKLGVSDATCCSQVEQGKASYHSVPPLSPDVSKYMHGVNAQITRKDLQKDEQPLMKPPTQKAVYKHNISSATLESRNSCRACEWSGMGQLNLAEDTWNLNNQEQQIHVKAADTFTSNEKPMQPSMGWQQRTLTPRELSIDDWVLSQAHGPVLRGDGLPGQVTRQSSASRSLLRSNGHPSQLARRYRSPNQSMSRASAHWMNKNYVETIESPSPLASQHSNYVHGLRVPLRRDNPIKDSSVKNLLTQSRARGTKPRDKDLGHRRIISPTLLDHHKSGQVMASSDYNDESSQERSWDDSKSYQSSQSKIPPYEEYEDTASASWTSEPSRDSNGEMEAYSSPSWTNQQSSGSYSESEVFSSPKNHRQTCQVSKTKAHVTDDRSSCSERSHGSRRGQSEHSNSNASYKMKRSSQQEKGGKGGLRRVKHMFGFIFQPFNNHRDQNNHAKEGRTKSNWKRVQKIVHTPSNKGEVDENRAIQVSRKSEGTKGAAVKNQAGHFWGMLVHVNKAKKLKPLKGGGKKGMVRGENVKALANKKLNGWQKLHHHTKVKLPNKRKPLTRKLTLLDHQR